MFVKDKQQIDGSSWVPFSLDGSGTSASMVVGQPINASPEQLALMGVTVQADPPPPPPSPPPPPPIPQIISDRQFYQQAAIQGLCTTSEALAAVQIGSLPSSLSPLVNALPADQQFGAKMMLSGNVTFVRTHPLVIQLGQAFFGVDKAAAALDALWAAAALL